MYYNNNCHFVYLTDCEAFAIYWRSTLSQHISISNGILSLDKCVTLREFCKGIARAFGFRNRIARFYRWEEGALQNICLRAPSSRDTPCKLGTHSKFINKECAVAVPQTRKETLFLLISILFLFLTFTPSRLPAFISSIPAFYLSVLHHFQSAQDITSGLIYYRDAQRCVLLADR